MSFGKMNRDIVLITTTRIKDAEGFSIPGETIVAKVRAYLEERHGTESWVNRAAFSTATALFRFRTIPNVTPDPSFTIRCGDDVYKVLSVEDIKGRGMYYEVLAEKVTPNAR